MNNKINIELWKLGNELYIITCGPLYPQLLSFPGEMWHPVRADNVKLNSELKLTDTELTEWQIYPVKLHWVDRTAPIWDKQLVLCLLKFISVASALVWVISLLQNRALHRNVVEGERKLNLRKNLLPCEAPQFIRNVIWREEKAYTWKCDIWLYSTFVQVHEQNKTTKLLKSSLL